MVGRVLGARPLSPVDVEVVQPETHRHQYCYLAVLYEERTSVLPDLGSLDKTPWLPLNPTLRTVNQHTLHLPPWNASNLETLSPTSLQKTEAIYEHLSQRVLMKRIQYRNTATYH